MDLTKDDFQTWLANPVTQEIRAWAREKQADIAASLAKKIIDEDAVFSEQFQQEIIHESTGYRMIHELKYEDINDSENTTDDEE